MLDTSAQSHDAIDDLIARRRSGFTLEQPFYTSPAIFERDMAGVYLRHWLFAGHTSRIPNPGDYFLYQVGGESLIIVRGTDGSINALSNVCRHRGSRICISGEGSVRKFVCPYHAWIYDRDGKLQVPPHMPANFDTSRFDLRRSQVRVVEGLIFVCYAENPPDFASVERDLGTFLRPHQLERTKIARRTRHMVAANWKLVAENFWECYHCGHTHPEFCSVMSYARANGSERLKRDQATFEHEWEAATHALGHLTGRVESYDDTYYTVSRLPIRRGYVTQSQDGQPVAPLLGTYRQYDGGVTAFMMFPLLWFVVCNDHAMLARFTPIAPLQTEAELTWLVHEDAVEGVDYDPDRVSWLWQTTADEDWTLCENNQRGVSSPSYTPGMYSLQESIIDDLIAWYLREIAVVSSR